MRTRKSNFVTRSGLIFLTAIVLVAAYFKLVELTCFLGLILLLCLCAFAWAKYSLSGIIVKCSDSAFYAFPGEEFDLSLSLENGKSVLLMWLDCVLPFAQNRCIGQNITEYMTWILPHQTISWHRNIPAASRGVAVLSQVRLSAGDGFGLSEEEKSVPLPSPVKLVVYPKVHPIDPAPVLRNMSELETSKSGICQDRTLIKNIRDYQDGDNFRDINWRMMAKTGDVYVSIHETMAMRRVCFLPDFSSFSYQEKIENAENYEIVTRVHEDELEHAISEIASYIVALHSRDVICTLLLPSVADAPAKVIIPETQETQIVELLGTLAEISYHGEASQFPRAELDEYRHLLGQVYIWNYHHGLVKLTGDTYETI